VEADGMKKVNNLNYVKETLDELKSAAKTVGQKQLLMQKKE
jgi:hypothetical protein